MMMMMMIVMMIWNNLLNAAGQFFDIIKFTIEILDVNDHSPNFGDHWTMVVMTLNISESVLPGSSFNLPAAVDQDGVEFGVQRYRLMSVDQPADSTDRRSTLRLNPGKQATYMSSETAPPAPSLVGIEELPAPSSRDALFPKAIGLI